MSVFGREALANGVRILTAPMPQAQSVACFVGFAAGSRCETSDTRGFAHFVEHMLFTGTERRPSMTALTEEVDGLGAILNARTGKETTAYYVRCTAQHVDRALDVLVDMVRNSTFQEPEIEREKGVIAEEMNMVYQSPREYIDEVFEALLYGDRPLGWAVLGTRETVAGADRARLVRYVEDWYTASRLVVGVAGGFDADLRPRVEELLGDLAAGNGNVAAAAAPERGRVGLESKDSEQAEIALGAPSFPLDHPDRYVVAILRAVLGGGMSSRLYRELVSERGLAYEATAVTEAYADTGAIWAQGGVNADKVDEAVGAVARQLQRLADEPVPADELEKARNYARGRFVFQTETPQGLMSYALQRELVEGVSPEPAEVVAGLDAVTVDDVQRVAGELFAPGRLRLAMIGPFDDAARFEPLLG